MLTRRELIDRTAAFTAAMVTGGLAGALRAEAAQGAGAPSADLVLANGRFVDGRGWWPTR